MYDEMDANELREYKERLEKAEPVVEKSVAWGRKLIEEAVAYARQLGFAPARDYKKATRVFGGANAADCSDSFVFGERGKPLYVPSSNDSEEEVTRILRLLSLKCGRDGYHYILPADPTVADIYLGHVDEVWLVDEVNSLVERAEEGTETAQKRARLRLGQLLVRHPGSPVVLYGLGVMECLSRELRKARLRFREALVGAPDLPWALFQLSRVCLARFRLVEAKTAAERALKAVPEDHDLHKSVRDILERIEQMQKESGVSETAYWTALGNFEAGVDDLEADRVDEALINFREAAKILPEKPLILANMGLCLAEKGDFSTALACLDKACELDTQNKSLESMRGEIEAFKIREEIRKLPADDLGFLIEKIREMKTEEFDLLMARISKVKTGAGAVIDEEEEETALK
ncbi:MAG: hypothetical protein JJT96_19780 [Opitutales bacterium]|nr:hypothetical protein [Opitutales bacterium]